MKKRLDYKKIAGVLFIVLILTTVLLPAVSFAQPAPQGPQPLPPPPAPQPVQPPPAATVDPDSGCQAGWIACGIRSVFGWIIQSIIYIWFVIVQSLINLAAILIQSLIQISGGIVNNPLVSRGFSISLGLANLGFVLAIIILAFITILRLEGYQTKKFLMNLIIAAVLINFSLAIAGVIIDFTNVISDFFVAKSSPRNIESFSANMASSLDMSKVLEVKKELGSYGIGGGVINFATGLVSIVISLALALIVSIFIMLTFWGIAGMILVRYIYLTILLILMPLAWLFWTIPNLSGYFSQWWGTFLRQAFFLPAVTFFLYLAMAASAGVDALVLPTLNNPITNGANTNVIQEFGAGGFINTLIKVGLFAAALMAGNALGAAGSKGALGAAMGVKDWTVGKIKGTAAGAAVGTGRLAKRGALGWLGSKGPEDNAKSRAERFQERVSKVRTPLLGTALRGISRGVTRLAEGGKGKSELEEAAKRSKDRSREQRKGVQMGPALESEKLENWIAMAKDGQAKDIDAKLVLTNEWKQTFISRGKGKEFEDIEKALGMNVEMMNALKAGDQSEMNDAAMKFMAGLSDADKKKIPFDDIFKKGGAFGIEREGEKRMLQNAAMSGIAVDPGTLSKAIPKIKAKNIDNFKILLKLFIQEAKVKAEDENDNQLRNLVENLEKSSKRNFDRRMFGFEEPETAPPAEEGH